MGAPAVVFDLMQPFRAGGRLGAEDRGGGLYESLRGTVAMGGVQSSGANQNWPRHPPMPGPLAVVVPCRQPKGSPGARGERRRGKGMRLGGSLMWWEPVRETTALLIR